MQDNFDNKNMADEAFLNDSWEKMSTLLDNDLPVGGVVAESSREYTKYAVLLLLMVLLGGGLWWSQSSIPEVKGEEQNKGKEIHYADGSATMDAKRESRPYITELKTNQENQTEAKSENVEQTISSVGKLMEDLNKLESEITFPPKEIKNVSTTLEMPASKLETKNIALEEEPMIELDSDKTTEQILIASKSIEVINNTFDLSKISLPSSNHDGFAEANFETKKLIKINKPTKKWSYGLMAGVQQEKFDQGFGGLSIGVIASRGLTKQFTLETGLSYSLMQFNQTVLNNSPSSIEFGQPVTNNTSGVEEVFILTYDPSDENPVDPILLGSASWLSLPVLLTYQPSRKWRINMGVEYAQLLNAKQQKIFDGTSYDQENITDLIAGNNISALTGITWLPSENVGIDIRYQYGFTDLSKSNPEYVDQTHTRAALQWSLVYYFNAKRH